MPTDDRSIYLVDCTHCDQAIRVGVESLGRAGVCPVCSQSVTVVSVRAGSVADSRVQWIASLSASASDLDRPGSSRQRTEKPASRPAESGSTEHLQQTDAPSSSHTLGRFALQRKLGQGGFGEVWLAEDTQLKRLVALKLPRFAAQDEKRKRRFLAESRTAAVLRHPNIVPVLDAGKIGPTHFIASEFVRGVALDDIHKDRPASVQWTVKTLIKLARATHFAHQHQIVHRDLKPDNVLIDRQGEPQVLDFGLAKRLDDTESRTMDGTVMGTPHYMSPEQARGEIQRVGAASDQFSLGVILYRLLTGQTPHNGQPLVVLKKLIEQPTPSLGSVEQTFAKDLVAICDKARSAEIEDRYSDCEALAEDLQRFADGLPVAARPPSRISRAAKWTVKHPRESALAVSCVAATLTLFSVSLIGWNRAQRAADQAATTASELRRETSRLVGLQESLAIKVDEAAQLRDRTAAAQQRAVAARQQLQSETEQLNQQTLQAEQSLAKLQQTTEKLIAEEARQKALESTLADTSQTIDEAMTGAQQIRSTAADATELNPQFTSAERDLIKDDRKLLLCKTDGEAFVVRPRGTIALKLVAQAMNPKRIRRIAFDTQGQLIGAWGNGGTEAMGIAKLAIGNRWVPFVPIRYLENGQQLRQQSLPQYRQMLEQGMVQYFMGEFALDSEDRLYYSSGHFSPAYIVRFDPQTEKFDILFTTRTPRDLQFRPGDPDAIYLSYRYADYYVLRRDLSEDADTPETLAILLRPGMGGVRSMIPLADNQWFADLSKNRMVRIDLATKTYVELEIQGRPANTRLTASWAPGLNGQWVAVAYDNIAFYQPVDAP